MRLFCGPLLLGDFPDSGISATAVQEAENLVKLIYFGNDPLASCVDVFLDYGWSIEAFYTSPLEGTEKEILAKAEQLSTPTFSEKPSLARMNEHVEAGACMFFSAEYLHKIPIPAELQYAVNMHTSLLPMGRGPSPLPYILERYPEASGLTLHKLSEDFDRGDIILKREVDISSTDSMNTLAVKMYVEAPKILRRFLAAHKELYGNAQPQSDGETWPIPSASARMLDWHMPAERLNRQIKAFGHFGTIIRMDNKYWRVVFAETIRAPHSSMPGELLFQSDDLLAVSCLDGFVCIPKRALMQV